ncbi:hypothetical protein K2173_004529 [Erythroxylum novogranatense]|uniref:Uncharacterized protein n=1 Tax=Erythroxylum novogranatense TaxID=1862640 RepID=A0AAV8T638_9ROSI|nr:hypothetical protein K2173_004529 [Erythroxylum novogranatense]
MDVVCVFGGARSHLSSSTVLRSSTARISSHLTSASTTSSSERLFNIHSSHLAPFSSLSYHFLCSTSHPLRAKPSCGSTKTHIFLPHLVASMEQFGSCLWCLRGAQ